MSYSRYPTYKESGVEWLGEVPKHWEVRRLKSACHVFPSNVDKKSQDGETPVQLCNYTDVYYNDTITAGMDLMAATATQDQISKFTLRAGDTIITKDSETSDDIAISAYVPADLPGVVCGYHLSMIRPLPGTDGAFVKRLFDSTYAKSCVAVRANGLTRVGLGQYEIDNLAFAFPPLQEQSQIVAFLDRETAKIDELAKAFNGLIALLKEKRQAVISHAVTKGLDPSVPMKDSGVEWVGKIPAAWRFGSLSYFATLSTGSTPDRSQPHFWNGEIPWVKTGEIRYETIVETEECITPEGLASCSVNLAPAGTLLMALYGQGVTRGRVAILGIPATFNQACAAIQVGPLVDVRFLQAFFEFSYPFIRGIGNETTQMNLNLEFVRKIRIAAPSIDEQRAIANFIEIETGKLDCLIDEASRSMELLQERRSALISAAVTGKIDVRGLVKEVETEKIREAA